MRCNADFRAPEYPETPTNVWKMSQPAGLGCFYSHTLHYSTILRVWVGSVHRPHAVLSPWDCSHQYGATTGDCSQSGPSLTMATAGKASSLLIFWNFSWCWCLDYACIRFLKGHYNNITQTKRRKEKSVKMFSDLSSYV